MGALWMNSDLDILLRLIRLLSAEERSDLIPIERIAAIIASHEYPVGWHDYFLARLSINGNTTLGEIASCDLQIDDASWIHGRLDVGGPASQSILFTDAKGLERVINFGDRIRNIVLKAH